MTAVGRIDLVSVLRELTFWWRRQSINSSLQHRCHNKVERTRAVVSKRM